MENTNQPQQLSADQVEAYVLDQYVAKKKKKIIEIEFADGKAVLVHKQNNALGEPAEPIRIVYTSSNLARGRITRRQRRDQIELQLIALQEQLVQFDADTESIYTALESDVLAAEMENQPSEPKKAERK